MIMEKMMNKKTEGNTFTKKIGQTVYVVRYHFNEDANIGGKDQNLFNFFSEKATAMSQLARSKLGKPVLKEALPPPPTIPKPNWMLPSVVILLQSGSCLSAVKFFIFICPFIVVSLSIPPKA